MRLKFAATICKQQRAENVGRLDLEDVQSGSGRILGDPETIAGRVGTANLFQEGDVLFGKLRPYLAKAVLCEADGACSPEFVVFRPDEATIRSRYLHYTLLSGPFIAWAESWSTGAKMPRTSPEILANFELHLPDLEDQDRICAVLDARCSQIDQLIERSNGMVALINERTEAHAQSLFGTARSQRTRLRFVVREVDRRSETGEEELLALTKGGLLPRSELAARASEATTYVGYKLVAPGEIVMNKMQAWNGMFAVAELSGMVSPDYTVLRALDIAEPRFLAHLFSTRRMSGEFHCRARGIGSGFLRLYTPDLYDVRIDLPDRESQGLIADQLDRERSIRLRLLAKLDRRIKLLKERREALVTAGVTQGLDLRSAVA